MCIVISCCFLCTYDIYCTSVRPGRGCFSAAGPGRLVKVEGKLNAAKYCKILEDNLIQSPRELQLGRFIFQQDNDPKHTAKATQKLYKDNKVNVLEWVSQSPDVNPIENLWSKIAVHISTLAITYLIFIFN